MNKLSILSILTCFVLIFVSCSSDDDTVEYQYPEVQTLSAIVDGTSVILGGNLVKKGSGGDIQERGVCWSTTNLPEYYYDNTRSDFLNQMGIFQFSIDNELQPNTVYYARAFVINETNNITYGEVVTFTTGNYSLLKTLPPTEILTNQAILKGHLTQPPNESSLVNFAYSKTPNPTINNNTISTVINGTDTFQATIEGLDHSTTYYVRTFIVLDNNEIIYGEQKEFKTAGYVGPAGGYIAYDKGEDNEGWRFLEIYPQTLSYNINQTTGGAWGTYDFFISGTTNLFGMGIQNTDIISNNDPADNCAAKLCKNAVINGYSDWFLASSDELLLIAKSLKSSNIMTIDHAWTSTQYNALTAKSIEFHSNNHTHYVFNDNPKSYSNLNIYPVRRY